MNTEALSEMLVRASKLMDSALVAPAAVVPQAAAAKVLAHVACGGKFDTRPLVRETREVVDVEFVGCDVQLTTHEEFARFTRNGRTVAAPAATLIEGVDDSHFTGESATAQCACDASPSARALYAHRDGVRQLPGWNITAAGLSHYNGLARYERKAWLERGDAEATAVAEYFALVQYVASVEETCPAASHYRETDLDISLGNPRVGEMADYGGTSYTVTPGRARESFVIVPGTAVTRSPNEKALEERARWSDLEWRRLAWPVVAFQHHYAEGDYTIRGDGDRGYRADPTWIASEGTLEREYHLPRTVRFTEFVRDAQGYILLDDQGRRLTQGGTALRSGEVHREYRRRDWCEANGRFFLPFLPPSQFKAHADFLRGRERARLHAKRQRAAIARLVVALGGDVHDPAVASWVGAVGYQAALDALRARARREGVSAYC